MARALLLLLLLATLATAQEPPIEVRVTIERALAHPVGRLREATPVQALLRAVVDELPADGVEVEVDRTTIVLRGPREAVEPLAALARAVDAEPGDAPWACVFEDGRLAVVLDAPPRAAGATLLYGCQRVVALGPAEGVAAVASEVTLEAPSVDRSCTWRAGPLLAVGRALRRARGVDARCVSDVDTGGHPTGPLRVVGPPAAAVRLARLLASVARAPLGPGLVERHVVEHGDLRAFALVARSTRLPEHEVAWRILDRALDRVDGLPRARYLELSVHLARSMTSRGFDQWLVITGPRATLDEAGLRSRAARVEADSGGERERVVRLRPDGPARAEHLARIVRAATDVAAVASGDALTLTGPPPAVAGALELALALDDPPPVGTAREHGGPVLALGPDRRVALLTVIDSCREDLLKTLEARRAGLPADARPRLLEAQGTGRVLVVGTPTQLAALGVGE